MNLIPIALGIKDPLQQRNQLLRDSIRPEFSGDYYLAQPSDPVLFGYMCAVEDCSFPYEATKDRVPLCSGHFSLHHNYNLEKLPIDAWVQTQVSLDRSHMCKPCAVEGCNRSRATIVSALCGGHAYLWEKQGKPEIVGWKAGPVSTREQTCQVRDCCFPAVKTKKLTEIVNRPELCDGHNYVYTKRFSRSHATPDKSIVGFQAMLDKRPGLYPRFEFSDIESDALRLELQYALQMRHDKREAKCHLREFASVKKALKGVQSVTEVDAKKIGYSRNIKAFVSFTQKEVLSLQEKAVGGEVWEKDVWVAEFLPHYEHFSTRRQPNIVFGEMPVWWKTLVKRWARMRIETGGISFATVASNIRDLRKFSQFMEREQLPFGGPEDVTRETLELWMHDIASQNIRTREAGAGTINMFLQTCRVLKWAEFSETATFLPREITGVNRMRRLPRFIDEELMRTLEDPENIQKLKNRHVRLAVQIAIETGLRVQSVISLKLDSLFMGSDDQPYLLYENLKGSREAVVPISQELAQAIREAIVLNKAEHPETEWLTLATVKNPDGKKPLSYSTINGHIKSWIANIELRNEKGELENITMHRFRHTLATRWINNGVPEEVVRQMLDHKSAQMTQVYARISDKTLRKSFDEMHVRVDIKGERIPLDTHGLAGQGAWMKEHLARAKQALPNGYCTLPLRQSCPHPNACLTCPSFATDESFRDLHENQLLQIENLIVKAEEQGSERMLEVNQRDYKSLKNIIDGLDRVQQDEQAKEQNQEHSTSNEETA